MNKRWNFEATEDAITVCRDHHQKGQPCEYEELSTYEVVDIINDLRSKLLALSNAVDSLNTALTNNQTQRGF